MLTIKLSKVSEMMKIWGNNSAPKSERRGPKLTLRDMHRFAKKVDFTRDCYHWTGRRLKTGYGVFTIMGRHYYAHRVAWSLANSSDVPPGKQVTHQCHNPSCVNPEHLRAASPRQNAREMIEAGRRRYYRSHGKLDGQQVRHIRQLRKEGMTYRELGERFGIHEGTARLVAIGERYRDIPD